MSKFTWFTGRGPALTQQQLQRREALSAPALVILMPIEASTSESARIFSSAGSSWTR